MITFGIIVIAIMVTILTLALINISEEDREANDEEQIKFLKEYTKKYNK